jgi:CubicO group peptidase (beta-lactamase class C family)
MATTNSSEEGSSTTQGLSKQGLASFNKRFHELVNDGKLANIVTLVARHGEIVNLDAYGVQDISATPPVPVKSDSIFRIASMVKPIVGVGMMMLYEEGKWTLEDPVSKFIPEFENLQVKQDNGDLVPQESTMTMKQLMSHTAGFGPTEYYTKEKLRAGDLQDMINFLAGEPLPFQPGKAWRYGPSVDIQGYIIQKLTGLSLDEFLEQRIYGPLGMVDSSYVVPASRVDRLVSNHKFDDDGKLVSVNQSGTYNLEKPKFIGGGGGLSVSTVKDYWRFAQMVLNGGELNGQRLLQASSVGKMHTNVLEPGVGVNLAGHNVPGLGFGLGFAIVEDAVASRASQGPQSFFWGGLFGTWFWIDPLKDLIVIGFVNFTTARASIHLRELSAKLIYSVLED